MEEQEGNVQEIVQQAQENGVLTREDIQTITTLGVIAIALLFAIWLTKGR